MLKFGPMVVVIILFYRGSGSAHPLALHMRWLAIDKMGIMLLCYLCGIVLGNITEVDHGTAENVMG